MERTLLRRPPRPQPPGREAKGFGFAPTLVLTVTLAAAAICLAVGILRLAMPETVLAAPFPPQNQDAETLIFVVAFGLILPLALYLVPRIADRVAAGGNRTALPAIAAIAAASFAAMILAVRLLDVAGVVGGLEALLVLSGAWLVVVVLLLRRAVASEPSAPLLRLSSKVSLLSLASAVFALAAMLAFVDLDSIVPLPLIAALAIGAAAAALRERWQPVRLDRWPGRAVDGVVVLLLVLAVPNVVVFSGEPFETSILQFHQDFFLGPANQLLGGGAMLVDTFSQYGVGSIAFLAGAFQIAPAGNGAVALVEGVLSAAMFVSAYLVLRIARVSRPIAATALALAVFALVFALVYPLGGLLQHGAIRFGMPVAVIVPAVAAARWPDRAGLMRALELLVVGVASTWALEAFAYTVLTFVAILALEAALLPPGQRRSRLARGLVAALAAVVVAHAAFALATLIGTGELPDWGRYVSTLRAFLTGKVGDLTYDFVPWSAPLLVGALYLSSAAAVVLLVRHRRDLAVGHRTELIALAGVTAWGVALFSYFVNRSAGHILPYVSLPAVMAGALWLSLLLRGSLPVPARTRDAAMAAAAVIAAVIVAVGWSRAGHGYSESALAHVVPGGDSLPSAVDRLWSNPVLKPGTPDGVRLLETQMPSEDRSLVLTDADLGIEILTASGRTSELPFGDPWEDSLVPEQHLEALGQSVDELEPGQLMLVDDAAIGVFRGYLADPTRDPLENPIGEVNLVPTGIASLQEWVLKEIGRRFQLRTVASGEYGLRVVELVPPVTDQDGSSRAST